jgi:hypothetical protein
LGEYISLLGAVSSGTAAFVVGAFKRAVAAFKKFNGLAIHFVGATVAVGMLKDDEAGTPFSEDACDKPQMFTSPSFPSTDWTVMHPISFLLTYWMV